MKHKIKNLFLFVVFCCCCSLFSHGQRLQHPPEPMAQDVGTTSVPGEDCAQDPDKPGQTPPPGLCLPINDYVIPLLLAGILLGAYQVHRLEKA